MKHLTGLGLALISAAVLGACGARTSLVDDIAGSAMAGPSFGGAGASGAVAIAGASSASGGFEQGGTTGGFGGAPILVPPTSGAGGFEQGGATGGAGASGAAGSGTAGSPPLTCSTGVRGGGYVDPCLTAGSGGASGECRAFDLVGAYWNGIMSDACIEAVDDVSAATGVGIERGMLGDLHTWESEQFAESEDGLRVGAVGTSQAGERELHLLELASGVSRSVPIAHDYSLAGVLSSGAFVGMYLENGSLFVELIDSLTGKGTSVGSVADVSGWSSQLVLDRPKNRVYALADSISGSTSLYNIDLSNGASSSNPLPWNGFLGGVTTDGQIVAMSSGAGVWTVSLIDPLTAIATKRGIFSGLSGASFLVYDSTLGVAHTVSSNAQGATILYNFDLASGKATEVATKRTYTLAKQ
jgi:hypothetical protein